MRRKKGFSNVFFILFLFVFAVVTSLTVEFYHIYTVKEYIDTELSRALNIATDYAMLDEYRMEHISMIDIPTAKNEFNSYLHSEMKLNGSNERVENGEVVYTLVIKKLTAENDPVKFEAVGVVRTKPVLLSSLVPVNIDIPFKVKARNQRYE
ncbi:MAG: hypothetical protein Q4F84_08960 [Fibrobacter sp.]|nr:hypothetical protein [Fibrobacter sp.]